ncbi:MAG: penicillin-binding protein 2 [Acidimicrobiia bacterium]|nr:penicillin-binding protein 2 [Acidimicrobiia bacterium]
MKGPWRVAVLAVFFLGLLVVLTLRLWSLQLTEAAEYQDQADRQQILLVSTPAPRGDIVDVNGVLMAGTRPALSVVVNRKLIPVEVEESVIQRLAVFLGIPAADLRQEFEDHGSGARFTVADEIDSADALFLAEHTEDFPGVAVEPVPVRIYPLGVTGGQFIGYIGRPTEADIEAGVRSTDRVGKAGVEREYDSELQGEPGAVKYRIDAQGNILGLVNEQSPQPGGTIQLTIDSAVQAQLESALADGLQLARNAYNPTCRPVQEDPKCPIRAVGVVLDAKDGSVVAMASVPGYDPTIFVDGVSSDEWNELLETAVFNNFAIQGIYAPASTFKAIAYVAAMEEGIFPETAVQTDTGQYFCEGLLEFRFQDGSPQVYRDWKADGHGPVDLHTALQSSCDVYFWEVALKVWRSSGQYDEALLQDWARKLGFGVDTGIDLPFEQSGLIPDRAWFDEQQAEGSGRVRAEGGWSGGDLMNTVIGQGDVLVTPLQLATAYAAIVNGGTVWQPRVVAGVLGADGEIAIPNDPVILNDIPLAQRTVDFIRQDLQLVVNGPAGTARAAFESFGPGVEQIGGKTGTGEVIKSADASKEVDTAWFVGVAPVSDPEYVVAIVIERGGSGGRIAAPTARQVLQFLMLGEEGVTDIAEGAEAD